jgi:hypothetical protein
MNIVTVFARVIDQNKVRASETAANGSGKRFAGSRVTPLLQQLLHLMNAARQEWSLVELKGCFCDRRDTDEHPI